MELKAWEPIEELEVAALDTDCERIYDDPERPQKYGSTVVGFCLDDVEGCRSIMDFTTGEGREADEALAALVARSMRVAAGMQAGGCPYCFGDVLYCDRHDQAKGVAHCDDCGAELTMEQYQDGLRWLDHHKVLTCVYCGTAYPEGTPPHGSQILTDHIKVCEKHPLRVAEATIKKLRSALAGLVGVDGKEELDQMEVMIRIADVSAKDKMVTLDAVHVLQETIAA